MNDLGNLLQMIYDLLTGWYNSFTSHAVAVMEKLNLIEEDTASIKISASDIKSNTDDIKDNTGAIITPVQSIKTNTDSIKNDTTTIKNNVSTMSNQLGTISTNVGTASAFTEDVANNTLDIKNRIVTIGSDTTQLRSNSNTITSDVSDIKTALNYYLANTPVTEDVEGSICNIDTDLTDYLQACKVIIPADAGGISGFTLNKCGVNLFNSSTILQTTSTPGNTISVSNEEITISWVNGSILGKADNFILRKGTYTFSAIGTNIDLVYLSFIATDNTSLGNINLAKPQTKTFDKDFYIFFYGNYLQHNTAIFKLQIESGSASSDWTSYVNESNSVTFGSSITDGAEVDLLSGIVKINTSPITYNSITPLAIRTFKGVNNIYSDIGTTALTYRETLKHYIDKQEA